MNCKSMSDASEDYELVNDHGRWNEHRAVMLFKGRKRGREDARDDEPEAGGAAGTGHQ